MLGADLTLLRHAENVVLKQCFQWNIDGKWDGRLSFDYRFAVAYAISSVKSLCGHADGCLGFGRALYVVAAPSLLRRQVTDTWLHSIRTQTGFEDHKRELSRRLNGREPSLSQARECALHAHSDSDLRMHCILSTEFHARVV